MAKGSGSKMLYFVLYVVLITELMIVITERDELEEEEAKIRDKMLSSIAQSYKAPITLSPTPKFLDFNVGSKDNPEATVVLSVFGLVSDEEKANVEFYVSVAPGSRAPDGWPGGVITTKSNNSKYKVVNDNGNARFLAQISSEGDYKFNVYCQVNRTFPTYLTPRLLEELKHLVGDLSVGKSAPESFSISAKRQGGVVKKGAEIVF